MSNLGEEVEMKSVPIRDLDRTRATDFRFVHANSASVAETFWDTMIVFGAVVPRTDQESPVIEERVGVSMSWEHLKALYRVLGRRIQKYEQTNGIQLREPSGITSQTPKKPEDSPEPDRASE
jgi:hypothetical protein